MADGDPPPYTLTVRHALGDGSRFEYVVSRPGFEAVRSEFAYSTYAAAKEAGDKHGHALAPHAAPSTADK